MPNSPARANRRPERDAELREWIRAAEAIRLTCLNLARFQCANSTSGVSAARSPVLFDMRDSLTSSSAAERKHNPSSRAALLLQIQLSRTQTQAEVAKRLKRYQSFVATVESGQRRIDVVEFIDFADAIGFDPRDAIKRLRAIRR